MHRGLSELMSEKAAVERYAALLIQERDAALDAAEEARRDAQREREFLLREQDRFIQLLLEEHEAELAQLRRTMGARNGAEAAPVPAEAAPQTAPVVPATALDAPVPSAAPASRAPEGRKSTPPGEGLSGAALARQALASTAMNDQYRVAPTTTDPSDVGAGGEARTGERRSSHPPPAVLDLEALASEVDGNSERPPPIRRLGVAEPKIHLKPARVPTELFDTLISPGGESDPTRKG